MLKKRLQMGVFFYSYIMKPLINLIKEVLYMATIISYIVTGYIAGFISGGILSILAILIWIRSKKKKGEIVTY